MTEDRTITFGEGEFEGMTFIPKCEKCGRYVRADREVKIDFEGQPKGSNATCSQHGRVEMIFIGYY